jgi:hypothetical protein
MSHAFGFLIESLVAVLLALTITYCFMLNGRLKRLKADEQVLKATISELVMATGIAERAVAGLKATAQECEATLGQQLAMAERCSSDLKRDLNTGEVLLDRIARVLTAARPLSIPSGARTNPVAEPAPPSPSGPDPKAVAAAAEAFAKRTRRRVGARAA